MEIRPARLEPETRGVEIERDDRTRHEHPLNSRDFRKQHLIVWGLEGQQVPCQTPREEVPWKSRNFGKTRSGAIMGVDDISKHFGVAETFVTT